MCSAQRRPKYRIRSSVTGETMFVRHRRTLTAAAQIASLGEVPMRLTGWAIGCLVILAVTGGALAQTPVERGKYLVNGILTSGNCHTPRVPGAVWDNSKQLS